MYDFTFFDLKNNVKIMWHTEPKNIQLDIKVLRAEHYKRRARIARTLESEVSSTENLHVV